MANPEYRNLIRFVKEEKQEDGEKLKEENLSKTDLKGNDAKVFYESVVDIDSCRTDKKNYNKSWRQKHNSNVNDFQEEHLSSRRKKLVSKEAKVQNNGSRVTKENNSDSCTNADRQSSDKLLWKLGNELLKCAEQGDLNEIKKLTKRGVEINHTDTYGWTALMCVCIPGHTDVVEFLLTHGADKTILNNQRKSALALAKGAGKIQAADLIENFDSRLKKKTKDKSKTEKLYCETCQSEYSRSSDQDRSHFSSTVHLFNLKLKPKPDPFMISESNVGYRLMRQSGWDGEKGLGPEGQGHRYPIRTTLKRDRSCLGSSDSKVKAKVTHYGPNDPDAVIAYQKNPQRIMSARAVSRRERLRREKKAKEWERNLRCEMNMD